jgi:ribosomal protein S18 acetylase RimI-like enzyme
MLMNEASTGSYLEVRIVPLDPSRIGEVARVLAGSLIDEPGFASIYPDSAMRRRVLESLMGMPVRDAVQFKTVWVATTAEANEIVGAAVWLPPGAFPITARRGLRLLPKMLALLRHGPRSFRRLLTMGFNAQRLFPDEPTWSLQILGVAPGHQGRGIGTRLIAPALALADANGEPAYLETGEEINLRFYRRAGFQVREAGAQLAPAPGPTHWTMYRPGRKATS